jgi:hypothetical protein
VIDPAVCMGVDTMDVFWRYAEHCALRAMKPGATCRPLPRKPLHFFARGLREQEPLVSRLFQERLAEPSD